MAKVHEACIDIEITVARMDPSKPVKTLFDHLSNQLTPEIITALGIDPSTLTGDETEMILESIDSRDCVINGRQVWSLIQGRKVLLSWAFSQVYTTSNDNIQTIGLGSQPAFIKQKATLKLEAYVFDMVEDIQSYLKSLEGRSCWGSDPVLIYPSCPVNDLEVMHGTAAGQIDLDKIMSEDYINLLNPPRT